MRKLVIAIVLAWASGLAAGAVSVARADTEPPKSYRSPQRDMCEQELAKDAAWQAELRVSVLPEVHQQEANLITRNNRHVVIAYAALWGLAVVFIVLMWIRQSSLAAEIARLEADVRKATEE